MSLPVALLPAAGAGRRFGADKLLAPLPDGTPVAVAAARRVRAAGLDGCAVVRAEATRLADALRGEGLEVVVNPAPQRGLGRSIARGVATRPDAAGWLVLLADMPWVHPDTIAAVANAITGGALLAAPVHAGRRGHPVGFHQRLAAELMRLDGDRGARALVARHGAALRPVAVDDPGVLRDVDTPADLPEPGSDPGLRGIRGS